MNNFITVLIICFVMCGFSQGKREHYVLPEFTEGVLLNKNGELSKGMVNYNALAEAIVLKEDSKYVPLRNDLARNADTLYVGKRKFVNRSGKFYELLLDSETDLFVEYYCVLKSNTEDRSAYGSSSQTGTAVVQRQVFNQNIFYDLELPELYTAELKYRYFIVTSKGENTIEALRDIKKQYSRLKKQYSNYKRDNKVNIKDPQSIAKLIEYLESNK